MPAILKPTTRTKTNHKLLRFLELTTMACFRLRTIAFLSFVSSMMMCNVSSFTARIGKRTRLQQRFRPPTNISPATRAASSSERLFSTAAQQDAPRDAADTASSSSTTTTNNNPRPTHRIIQSNTGGLRRLPVVRSPNELLRRAHKEAMRVPPDDAIRNGKKRAHKHGAVRLNLLMQELCVPLRDTVQGYRREFRRLHPFERVVADLSARSRQKKDGLTLETVLEEINEARKLVMEAGKDWIAKVKRTENAREAGQALDEGVESLLDLFQTLAAPPVTSIVDLQKGLRHAPVIQLDTPAVVLVGSPNVGKSTIVRAISSASPEVNNYPFTTRGMTLGHVEVFWSSNNETIAKAVVPDARRKPGSDAPQVGAAGQQQYAYSQLCQIMDSPGLLVRPDHERNEMEALTLAAMQHLPTAVCYVMDFSGGAGDKCSSIADQLELRREVRSRFPRRPWIDVVSKVDLGIVDGALEQLDEILEKEENAVPYVQLSLHEDIGVEELRSEILRMLGEVRVVLDAMAAVEEGEGGDE